MRYIGRGFDFEWWPQRGLHQRLRPCRLSAVGASDGRNPAPNSQLVGAFEAVTVARARCEVTELTWSETPFIENQWHNIWCTFAWHQGNPWRNINPKIPLVCSRPWSLGSHLYTSDGKRYAHQDVNVYDIQSNLTKKISMKKSPWPSSNHLFSLFHMRTMTLSTRSEMRRLC